MIFALAAPAGAAVVTIDETQSIQTAIDNLVASPDPADTLILNPGTYTQYDIVIKKNIIIRANTSYGHDASDTIIDAMRAGRIFDNNAGHALTADSLTLRNATVFGAGFGGAISNDNGGTLTVTSSRFFNCSANVGGAIFTDNGGTVTITGSSFTDCSSWFGGAITNYWHSPGTVTVTSSEFTRCTVSPDPWDYGAKGGAIGNLGTLTVTSSTFTDCSAQDAHYMSTGGAIYNYGGTATITSSVFNNCHTGSAFYDYWGGAILTWGGTLTVISSEFNNCSAPGGGAIHVLSGTATITGSTFTGCSAAEGGAIYSIAPLTITGSTFTGCTATGRGGAIFAYAGGSLTVTSSAFTGCSAGIYGGAIDNRDTLTVMSTTFTDCTAMFGGAISTSSSTVSVATSSFSSCTATNDGGAVYHHMSIGTLAITSSAFTSCSAADMGGAMFNAASASVASSAFVSCPAPLGGAVYSTGNLAIHFTRIYDCTAVAVFNTGARASADNNWWGDNADPSTKVFGPVNTAPWLVLGITADPAALDTAGTSAIRTNLTFNSDDLAPAGGYVPDGITNTYAIVSGSGSVSPLTDGTVNGYAQTTFTPVYGETVNISGTVDDQTVYIELPVAQAGPTVTGITPDTGVNSTSIAVTNLAGSMFTIHDTTTVRLMRNGHANITATGVTVLSPTRITCTLPIAGAEAGVWDVVVINPGGREAVLTGGFTVTATAPRAAVTISPTEDPGILSDFPQSPANPVMTVTVNIGGDSKAWHAVVTGTNLRDLIVTGTEQHGPFGSCNAPAVSVFQYLGLEPARYGTITNAVIHFTVPQSWLDENHIAPGSIVLYHMTPDCWQALPTTFLYAKDGKAYFSSQSSGFSSFAIAGTPAAATPAPVMTTQEIVSTPATEQAPAPAAVVKEPVVTQTTAPPAPAQAPAKSSPFPLVPVLAVICCAGIIGGGWYARRWWIRRQNPALFEEF